MSRLAARVAEVWREQGALGLVVAVSGGPDSVALVRALVEAGVSLIVAHLNHRLRGAESDADEAFVRELGTALGVTTVCHSLDIAELVRIEGGNLEAVARRERYAWLGRVAVEHGVSLIATGHNAGDQAETLLHRLLRGTGFEGLRGIAFRRPLCAGVELLRPLLDVTRAEVLEYLALRGQSTRHDATNDDLRYTRNRIRHELLPILRREYNPRIDEVLARLAIHAGEIVTEEDERAAALLGSAERPREGDAVVLDVATLTVASRRMLRAVLRLVWRREGWAMGGFGMEHWERAAEVCLGQMSANDLPGGSHIRRRGGLLLLIGPRGPL